MSGHIWNYQEVIYCDEYLIRADLNTGLCNINQV